MQLSEASKYAGDKKLSTKKVIKANLRDIVIACLRSVPLILAKTKVYVIFLTTF